MADMNVVNSQTKEIENIANELASMQKLLQATKDGLRANWSGNAYSNYIKAANDLDNDLKKCQNNLKNFVRDMRFTAMQLSAQKK
jgi:uncharacterized protein YukE